MSDPESVRELLRESWWFGGPVVKTPKAQKAYSCDFSGGSEPWHCLPIQPGRQYVKATVFTRPKPTMIRLCGACASGLSLDAGYAVEAAHWATEEAEQRARDEKRAADWNTKHPVGTRVGYWTGMHHEDRIIHTVTTGPAFVLDRDELAVQVEGYTWVAHRHMRVIA